jgi:signal transduction histidine kinase
MVNLLQNAIDALRDAPHGRKEVQLCARATNGMAEVTVHDTGRGLSAEEAERMFEPFFTTKSEGLGLGLAISRSIIEAHGGKIWLERSAGGKAGTTIGLTLPLRTKSKPKRRST